MDRKILVEVSARHVHLSQGDLATLFGDQYQLTIKKMLSQPGQYAAEEKVTIVGPKKELANVSILGPTRNKTQVELSATDARMIGLIAPIRESGDTYKSAPCKIVGPKGMIEISEGVIIAKRHIHLTPDDARRFQLKDKDVVSVKISTNDRSLIFGDVVIRVRDDFASAMHIDTDEGNAAGITGEMTGVIL
ncbi:MAG: phosphate propanoyltransferase [Candidatus Izemoplasmatales bacterium]|jgi:putative phosphotransacetylase|nr:phosphate propanoyltransferase [Candidatus Izemoplasmatales bacterium]MDD4354730.1 phosphate propanoyltransferase [Candidatus Izemoplasmatales bacterium]MDD4987319.1 phosphate propanoyltransferase [Candidatus Izemoplasmatales bacterium]MDD5601825.1 phosphate propanoyltransferase [Candidatus Izemoplasmatales bacterium]MDY0372881.1 phosphate propanoyltransferase [Candidatus Izemoplasmatales bacterium]